MQESVVAMRLLARLLSLSILLAGLWLVSSFIYAQDGEDEAEYAGARRCSSCHRELARAHAETRHSLALHVAEEDSVTLLADFGQDSEFRLVLFPDEMEPRPVQREDIAFVMGSGRHVQRFVYELDRDEYAVLPIQWNTIEQTWEPFILAENWPDPAYDFTQNCAGCHTTGLNVSLGRWEDDGVQCEACHGPASLHREAAREAGTSPSDRELDEIRAVIVRSPDAQICGQCHNQGHEQKNAHPYPVDYLPGLNLLDEDVFVLAATDDPFYWWSTGHAARTNMQFNEWLESAHASSLETLQRAEDAADACLQCHSTDYRLVAARIAASESGESDELPPDPVTLETAEFGVTCVTCHNPHSPPEAEVLFVDEPYAVCVDCHSNTERGETGIHHPVQEMFEGTLLVAGIEIEGVPGVHVAEEDGPDCLTCHMMAVPVNENTRPTHRFLPILPGEVGEEEPLADTCSGCHNDLTVTDLQFLVEDTQESVRSRLSVNWARFASLNEPEPDTDAHQKYEQIVALLTFVQNDGSLGIHNYAYADVLLTSAEQLMGELNVAGANLEPPEAPAPTATPAHGTESFYRIVESETPSGARPITVIVIGTTILGLLAGAALLIRRGGQ